MNTANIPAGNNFPKNTVLNMDDDIVEPLDSIVIYEHVCEKNNCKHILTLNLVGTTPAHLKGWELVKKRDVMTVGVSSGNGYFNKDRLEIILMGMASYFREVVMLVPDLPALHTYRALGYDERHAMERMKKHKSSNKAIYKQVTERSIQHFGQKNIRFATWSENIIQEECYQQALSRAVEIYHNNFEFREDILRNTERYILARLEDRDVQQLGGMREIVEKAAHYLVEEMAFFEISHTMLKRDSLVSYYRDLELGIKYVNGHYGNQQNKHLGCIAYNIVDSE